MAERGAHLSQLLTDSSRPSIFEVVAQEGLNQALRGVVKFCVRVSFCKKIVQTAISHLFLPDEGLRQSLPR